MDGIKVFEDDDTNLRILMKKWGEKNISAVYRKALSESVRHVDLHLEIDSLKKELLINNEHQEATNMLLQDLYHLVGAKIKTDSKSEEFEE